MRYERPAIESRVEMQALLGAFGISGDGGDGAVGGQPIWRPEHPGTEHS